MLLCRVLVSLVLAVVTAAPAAAQPRAEQVDAAALAAAAARLGRVIWAPVAQVDRVGMDPFVLRAPAADCDASSSTCLPRYQADFVVGGRAGADLWLNVNRQFIVQSSAHAVTDWYRTFADQRGVAPDVSQAVRYVAPRFHSTSVGGTS